MNILVTSASNKVPLIECIKSTCLNLDNLITADTNPNTITRFFSSNYWNIPLLEVLTTSDLIRYCNDNNITFIVPTRDAELLYFSRLKNILEDSGIHVLISSEDSISMSIDKLLFYNELHRLGIQSIPTSNKIDFEAESYVLKERFGAGSKKIYINIDKEALHECIGELENPIIQPFIKGKEYSIDLYITKYNKVKAIVVRERTLVIDGESQISEVVEHPKLAELVKKAALSIGLEGHVMFQAIEDEYGELWIVECNARIGGASTLSIYAGLDTFNWWIAECNGVNIDDIPFEIKKLKQIRYKKDLIL